MEDTLAFIIKAQNDRVIKLAAFLKRWEQEFEYCDPNMAMRKELQDEERISQNRMMSFP